ncbi:MAG TPA: DinB family protein [Candidatus Acidoferrum sp.]|nr:DinB family protein [Candidatus Acidoferrum sp.]
MRETKSSLPEPWLRGTLTEVPAVPRAVLHALELAQEDTHRWCGDLSNEQVHQRPAGLPSVAFQLRHIAGSIDRLLTYAEGRSLSETQLQALKVESEVRGTTQELLAELDETISRAGKRTRALSSADLAQPRTVGKQQLPATLGGLLVHVADHTQRHVGQAITTAKLISASKVF